jgi:transposase InsO family protein
MTKPVSPSKKPRKHLPPNYRQGLYSPVSYRKQELLVSENLLKQDFYVCGPNQKWTADSV